MNRIIIVEGPQGTGKTTLTNFLRDNISSSNLYRFSGQKEKGKEGLKYSIKMYKAFLDYLKDIEDIPMDIILDRSFFSEEVYANLGYKDYSFTDIYNELLDQFVKLNYQMYYINLYLKNVDLYEERLKRIHHNYHAFSKDSSFKQQEEYLKLLHGLGNTKINTLNLAMDDFTYAYERVINFLNLNIPTRKKNN